ncbi:MAG: hypothetical protein RLZ55_1290 [Actinomycetota bacterium]
MSRVVIIGGGPGGYEAALVAAQLGAEVTLIEDVGMGGSAVLSDCVPSKALVAVADAARATYESADLGVLVAGRTLDRSQVSLELGAVNARVVALARAQSDDIRARLERDGVRLVDGRGVMVGPPRVLAITATGEQLFDADVVLVATGARPRVLPEAAPDGERILTWEQVYSLTDVPEHLIVVGSGVTGAEFASAYRGLGSEVTLVSSREHVLPGQDPDAAAVIEQAFGRRGIMVMGLSRAQAARRTADGVIVTLADGRAVEGSHVLMAVGSVPNTERMGLLESGVRCSPSGHVEVDRVSRTAARGVYAAGDCTGVLALASVAAMQGRIAMWHALGDAVAPLDLMTVSSNVFTTPEIATVGVTQADADSGRINVDSICLPLATNPRAKMADMKEGFVKLFARRGTRIVVGGVIVAPQASELIYPVAIAVEQRLTVDEVAHSFTVYPSLSGSIGEAARRLHVASE